LTFLDFIPPTMESTSEPKQQPTGSKARPPSFANWPTLKILLPPTGRASVETDEWCFTYCSQNVTGRFHAQDAKCSTICVRKVFPHEVQNILNFKRHRVDADGQVRYPLPPEGQSSNLPRYLGGSKGASGSKLSSDSDNEQPPPPAPQHWKTGWYLWSTNKQRSAVEHLMLMNSDLARSAANDQRRLKTRQEWQEYQEFLQRTGWDVNDGTPPPEGKYWGARRPSKPFYEEQDHLNSTLLIPLPPPTPAILEKIDKLLKPSKDALELFKNDITSGTFIKFADRVWEKSFTEEPFVLAQRSLEKLSEAWKKLSDADDDGDNKKRR